MAKEVALIQVELIAEQIGGTGEIAILSATANATNQNEWIKFMEEELASNPDYADIELVAKVYGDDDDTKSFQEAQGLLQAYPNLKGIISPDHGRHRRDRTLPLRPRSTRARSPSPGLGLPNEMRPFVKDGTVSEFALWDPAQLGYVAAFAGKALADGDITGEEGDTFTPANSASARSARAASSSSARRPSSTPRTSTTTTSSRRSGRMPRCSQPPMAGHAAGTPFRVRRTARRPAHGAVRRTAQSGPMQGGHVT